MWSWCVRLFLFSYAGFHSTCFQKSWTILTHFFHFLSQIYPHRFPGTGGATQVSTHFCRKIIFFLIRSGKTSSNWSPPVTDFFLDFFSFFPFCFFLQPFPSHGFIKYSIPQPPGRQSVEVVRVLPPPSRLLTLFGLKTH